jgi:hypothetical protein
MTVVNGNRKKVLTINKFVFTENWMNVFKIRGIQLHFGTSKGNNMSLPSPKYYNSLLLGAFAELLKANISCDLTVRPHGTTWLQLDGFS